MHNIVYLNDEPLSHLSGKKSSNFIWKIFYKRAYKKLNKSLINIENIKKIIFNTTLGQSFYIDVPLGEVHINKEAIWYMNEKEKEFFVPLSISFSNGKESFDIVLLEGEIDLRRRFLNSDDKLNHIPLLVVVSIQTLEKCFELLLKKLEETQKSQERN